MLGSQGTHTLCFHQLNAWSQTKHACGCRVLLGHGSHPAQERKYLWQAVTPLLPTDATMLGWANADASSCTFTGIKDDPEQTLSHPLHPAVDEKDW